MLPRTFFSWKRIVTRSALRALQLYGSVIMSIGKCIGRHNLEQKPFFGKEARTCRPRPIGIIRYATDMSRRMEWQRVLDSEVKRWSTMSCEQLVSELHEVQAY